jgi:hypothetical protein
LHQSARDFCGLDSAITAECFRQMKSVLLTAAVLLLATPIATAAPAVPIKPDGTVLPNETDPAISTFNYPEAFYRPKANERGQLFILLTGTNGKNPFGLRLSVNASLVGYHVIQPMYPDDIPASICQNDENADAFSEFRWAIIEGGNSPHLRDPIPHAESIENRTIKLLEHLDRKYPDQHWGQFIKNGEIAWDKVAIGGMSQGGGHAALIATKHPVARVLCFGAPKDYNLYWNSPAKWYESSVTPPSRYFAFNNTHDHQACNCRQELEILARLGVDKIGGVADVDTDPPPYHHAHVLFTSWPGPDATIDSLPAHVSVIRDDLFDDKNHPLFRPVWIYMLTAPTE